jgi:glycosyltransferase involved in cell wall biosynthesis
MAAAVTVDVSPFLVNSAGVKTYLFHWLRALRAESAGRLTVETYPVAYAAEPLRHERSLFGTAATVAGLARLGLVNRLRIGVPDGDLFHATHLLQARPKAVRLTTTLYDLTYRLFPEMHTAATLECHRRFDARVLPHCRRVFCISESTARDAARVLRIPEDRLVVTYPGVEDRFFDADPGAARAAFGLPEKFILCLGTIEPRKNTLALLEAYAGLPPDVRDEYPLLFAGGAGWKADEALARIAQTPNARRLGFVPEEHLPGVVAAAAILAYPSLYEGFGIPLAQAMAARVAVLTANVSSMPEVVGDAGVCVDPKSAGDIRQGLFTLATSPALRAKLSERGRERAERFRWSVNARKSLQVFEAL